MYKMVHGRHFGGHLGLSAIMDFRITWKLLYLESLTPKTSEKTYYKPSRTKTGFRRHFGGHLGFATILNFRINVMFSNLKPLTQITEENTFYKLLS